MRHRPAILAMILLGSLGGPLAPAMAEEIFSELVSISVAAKKDHCSIAASSFRSTGASGPPYLRAR